MDAREALLEALRDATDCEDAVTFDELVNRTMVALRERGFDVLDTGLVWDAAT